MTTSDETYNCTGCAGEVAVVDAVWIDDEPYCCSACKQQHDRIAELEAEVERLKEQPNLSHAVLSTSAKYVGLVEASLHKIEKAVAEALQREQQQRSDYVEGAWLEVCKQRDAALAKLEQAGLDWEAARTELGTIKAALRELADTPPPEDDGAIPLLTAGEAKRLRAALKHIASPGRCANPEQCAREALAGV